MTDDEIFAELIEILRNDIIKLVREDIIKLVKDDIIEPGWTQPQKKEEGKKIIDLRLAIANEHEMQFCDRKSFDKIHAIRIGKLHSIRNNKFAVNDVEVEWYYCRYIENKWLINPNLITNSNMPVVPAGLFIRALLRDSSVLCENSHDLDFSIEDKILNRDIIAYEILGTSQGWKYEWE